MKVSVIIPNWNGQNLLKNCLKSVEKQTFKDFEIIVVDNGSSDNSKQFLRREFPKLKVIQLDKNYGFAKAISKGVESSKSEYVVFLNNDTETERNWLKNLVKCADSHQDVISVNSKLLNYHHKKIIDGAGIIINEVGQAKSIGWQEKDEGQYENERYIFGATGGASLFRRKDFVKVGMFDENYFMYYEEVDFAFRAQFLGYKSIYCPKAVVYHRHKETAKKLPQYIEYWQYRNMIATIIKDFPTSILMRKWRWLKIILVHLNTFFYQIRNGFFWPPFLTQIWIICHLPRLFKERLKIQRKRIVADEYIESFLRLKKITFWKLLP